MYLGQGIFVAPVAASVDRLIRYFPTLPAAFDYKRPQCSMPSAAVCTRGQGGSVIGIARDVLTLRIDLGSDEEVQSVIPVSMQQGRSPDAVPMKRTAPAVVDARLSFCRGHGNEPVPAGCRVQPKALWTIAWKIDFVAPAQDPRKAGDMRRFTQINHGGGIGSRQMAAIGCYQCPCLFDFEGFSAHRDMDRVWDHLESGQISLTAYALQVERVFLFVWDWRERSSSMSTNGPDRPRRSSARKRRPECRTIRNNIIEVGRCRW